MYDRPKVIQRGRQGNFGERGAASLSMLALPKSRIRTRDRPVPDVILDGDPFRGALTRQVPVESRDPFCQLVRADGNTFCHFSPSRMSVCRARYTLKEKTDARIDSEGRFFSPSETCCLESSFSYRVVRRKRGRYLKKNHASSHRDRSSFFLSHRFAVKCVFFVFLFWNFHFKSSLVHLLVVTFCIPYTFTHVC